MRWKVFSDYALQYGTTVEELAELNNIENPDLIKTGEKLQSNKNSNQKSSILQPTDIKLSDDQNSVFTNTCPVNQDTFTGSGMNESVCDGTICIAVQDKSSLKSKEWNELTIAKDESGNVIISNNYYILFYLILFFTMRP